MLPVTTEDADSEIIRQLGEPGTMIGGRFRVERLVGAGGMGCVVLARNVELDDLVAIKVLLPGLLRQKEHSARLLREARASVRIRSDHVVRVFDVTASGDYAPFIVMEYLQGESLGSLISRRAVVPAPEAAEIVIQACEAVAEAHHLGIVHRDLKPENLFITNKPGYPLFVKVLDFGISKMETPGTEQITQSQALLGSPAYAPPEQLRASRSVTPAADIWALGVILYECVTGTIPFAGETLAEIFAQILKEPPLHPRKLRADVPEAMARVILRCLDKDPTKRFGSVSELVRALAPFAPVAAERYFLYADSLRVGQNREQDTLQLGSKPGVSTAVGLTRDAQQPVQRGRLRPTRLRAVAIGGVVVVVVVFGVLAVRHLSSGSTSSAASSEPRVPLGRLATVAVPSAMSTPVVVASPAPPAVESGEVRVAKAPASAVSSNNALQSRAATHPSPKHATVVSKNNAPRSKPGAATTPWVDSR